MTRVRIKKQVSLNNLNKPEPTLTLDGQNRVTQMQFDHTSFRVVYTIVWDGNNIIITSYTQSFEDL